MLHSITPPVRNRALLTARSSSLRCVSAAEHQTAEKYSKTGRTKPRKHIPRSDLSWNTRQDFLKIPRLWEADLTYWCILFPIGLSSFLLVYPLTLVYSLTYWCILTHWCILTYRCIPLPIGVSSYLLVYPLTSWCILLPIDVYSYLLVYTHTYWCILLPISVYSYLLVYTLNYWCILWHWCILLPIGVSSFTYASRNTEILQEDVSFKFPTARRLWLFTFHQFRNGYRRIPGHAGSLA